MLIRRTTAPALACWLLAGCAPVTEEPVQGRPAEASPAEAANGICVRGRLTGEGVECQAMRSPGGRLYTLVGDLADWPASGEACVCGRAAALSTCMQGTTITVSRIGPPESCP